MDQEIVLIKDTYGFRLIRVRKETEKRIYGLEWGWYRSGWSSRETFVDKGRVVKRNATVDDIERVRDIQDRHKKRQGEINAVREAELTALYGDTP